MKALVDLLLPTECGGCERPGMRWCEACAVEISDHPIRLTPRVDPGVPAWALGRYTGPRRHAILAMKERGRRDLAVPLGAALATALGRLGTWGVLDTSAPLVLVPAPSRAKAARTRGGDPVARAAMFAVNRASVCGALSMARGTRDSVGLSATERRSNVGGRVRLTARGRDLSGVLAGRRDATVVFVDDVMTTGATATESIAVLRRAGIDVSAAVVIAGVG